MKKKYESINWSKVDPAIKAEFDIIKEKTKDFSDDELNKKFEANFSDLMSLVPADAIKKEEAAKPTEKKEAPAKKEAKPKKEKKAKAKKEKKQKEKKPAVKLKVGEKEISEISAAECLEQWRKRREAAKKSARKAKTTSVFSRITDKIESAVEAAIKNTPASEIKKDPEKYINRWEVIGRETKNFLQNFKVWLKEDYDEGDVKEFTKHFDDFISSLKKKYESKK